MLRESSQSVSSWNSTMFFVFSFDSDLLALDQSKTFYKPDWFDIVGAEVKCCKEAVCVIDMSSFTKFELTVSDAGICTLFYELIPSFDLDRIKLTQSSCVIYLFIYIYIYLQIGFECFMRRPGNQILIWNALPGWIFNKPAEKQDRVQWFFLIFFIIENLFENNVHI